MDDIAPPKDQKTESLLDTPETTEFRRVILESPFRAPEGPDRARIEARHVAYARAAMRDCLFRGEAPMASHLLYTQDGVLDDEDDLERRIGIHAGLAFGAAASATVVYADLGVSTGMKLGVERANQEGRIVEWRSLPGWASDEHR